YSVTPQTHVDIQTSTTWLREDEAATSIPLCRPFFVHKLYVRVESGSYGDAAGEVWVNGNVKGSLYAPGRDPGFWVTVGEETQSIQIKSTKNTLKVLSVQAYLSETSGFFPGPGPSYPFPSHVTAQMSQISNRVIWLVDQLEGYTNYQDYGIYLLPIKKAAAEALAVAEARGDLSFSARAFFEALLGRLDASSAYLNNSFEMKRAFHLSVELLSMREKIRRTLQ
ncbi:MAG: hypothetical protein HUU37_09510, partial [Bdellovibrionales bacterium]|nr:hypothetical protein [Bdellovibrionales bacterium]